jgi:hypothetical protein
VVTEENIIVHVLVVQVDMRNGAFVCVRCTMSYDSSNSVR